jgi:hypothetical protein
MHKRRIYQWIEYSSALYLFAIPFVQWTAYLEHLGANKWWTLLYAGIKVWMIDGYKTSKLVVQILIGLAMSRAWLLTTWRLFRNTNYLGTIPSGSECQEVKMCPICYGDFSSPFKVTDKKKSIDIP